MKRYAMKSMRFTVLAFGPVAFEIYFISFGEGMWGVIPEYGLSAHGPFESSVINKLRESMEAAGIIKSGESLNYDVKPFKEKARERSAARQVPEPDRVGAPPDLFSGQRKDP